VAFDPLPAVIAGAVGIVLILLVIYR